ncbi:MAG: PP2C family protein-serine/threonine phosphatase [Acidobacteriota bacterium]
MTANLAGPVLSSLRADFGALLVATVLCTIALAALAVYAFRWKTRDDIVLFFALFVGVYGLRLFAKTGWPEVLMGVPRSRLDHLTNLADDLIFLPAVPFMRRMLGADRWGAVRLLWWAAVAFAAVTVPYKIATGNWRAGAGGNELLVILFVAATIINVVPALAHGGRSDLSLFAVGSLIFTAFVVNGHLISHGYVPWRADPEPLGFLILVACLGVIVARRSAAGERRLEAVAAEFAAARQIQESILPRNLPSGTELDVAARYVPATEVGGDFYDFLVPGPGQLGVLIADVSGHGVPAALVASMIKMALAAQSAVAREPAILLRRLNELFCGRLHRQFLTAAYVYVDTAAGTARVAGAGHPPSIFYAAGRAAIGVESQGPLIGRFPRGEYAETLLTFSAGDRLLLYTDGVTESRNPTGGFLGEDGLLALMAAGRGLPAAEFLDDMIRRLREWTGGAGFDDDITMVVLDRRETATGR